MPHRYGLIDQVQPSGKLFLRFCPDFTIDKHLSATAFMNKYWTVYSQFDGKTNSMNGAIFELLFSALLINFDVTPFYVQSSVAFVPNVRYDILLFTLEKGPVGISLKTSLRERYKQADLEAYVLKNVHRKSESFIVTTNVGEASLVNRKIVNGDLLALNKVFHLGDIDELITYLSTLTIIAPPSVDVVTGRAIDNKVT
jgi:hypothetical protein